MSMDVLSCVSKPGKTYFSNANWFQRLTFSWVDRLLSRGRKNSLVESDLQLPAELRCQLQCEGFTANWEAEQKSDSPSLARALWKTYSREIIAVGFIKAIWGAVLIFTAFYLVRSLVAFMGDKTKSDDVGYGFSIGFFFACLAMSICLQQLNHHATMTGIRVRGALSTAIYSKALRAENVAQHSSEVINLLTNDCFRLLELCTWIHYIWSGPLEAVAIVILLITLIGNWGLIALGLTVLLVILQVWIATRVSQLRSQNIADTDQRVHLMHEILQNIKLVKFYAWEESFMEKVTGLRAKETHSIIEAAGLKTTNMLIVFFAPPAIAVLLFGLYVVYSSVNNKLDSTLAFTTLSLFNTLRFPLVVLPRAIKNMAEAIAALRRIQTFLMSPEVQSVHKAGGSEEQIMLQFDNASIAYRKDVPLDDPVAQAKPVELVEVMKDITFSLQRGKKMALVGTVGSGKSTIMLAALSETRITKGKVVSSGSIAYVPQFPWVQAGTVRNSILFGKPYDEQLYKQVIHACALERDLEIMPQGDMSMISERGTNLSGGQRQRVSLARAVYSNADVYLLDSPLSAVDWHTGNHIMHFAINGLLKHKTVVMVTHQLSLLSEFDIMAVVKEGRFDYCGPYNTDVLLQNFPSFAEDYASIQLAEQKKKAASGADASEPSKTGLFGPDIAMVEQNLQRCPADATPSFKPQEIDADQIFIDQLRLADEIDEPNSDDSDAEQPQLTARSNRSNSLRITVQDESGSRLAGHESMMSQSHIENTQHMSRADIVQLQLSVLDQQLQRLSRSNSRDESQMSDIVARRESFRLDVAADISKQSHEALHPEPSPHKQKQDDKPAAVSINAVEGRAVEVEKALQEASLKLAEEESRQDTVRAMRDWFNAGGMAMGVFAFLFFGFSQLTRIYSDWWISQWTTLRFTALNSDPHIYIYIYLGLVLLFAATVYIRGFLFHHWAVNASTNLHNRMFDRVLHAPLSFYSLRQLGGVLDAFSRHQDIIDEALPDTTHMTLIYCCITLTSIFLVVVVLPIYLVVFFCLLVAFLVLVSFYISTAMRLKQMVAQSSSPMLSAASESLDGIVVVRSFQAESRFFHQSVMLMDHHHASFFTLEELQCWLAHRLDFAASLLVLLTALLCVVNRETVAASATGLAISNSLQALVFFTWWVRGMADANSLLNSVSRIETLRNSVTESDPHRIEATKPPVAWPPRGQISFSNVTLRYLPWLDPALVDVSFNIKAGEKIGVIGRTGSGKSTLLMALFRLVGIETGKIDIDGIDIGTLGLADLRERLAIIPQEPVMFQGTVRSNLDPFGEYPEEDLWTALDVSNLRASVSQMPGGLDSEVQESGRNFSLGQRQLMCLSRAFLRKSSVLVLDEATAALDQDTDFFIQHTLRKTFAHCTIITIAHRLHSIIDSDRVLAMSAGKLVEFEDPVELLKDPESFFSQLVDQSGDQRDVLRSMVQEAALKRVNH